MAARWAAFGVWAAVAASALFWGLRLFVVAPAMPPHAAVAVAGVSAGGDPARVLGDDEPAAAAEAPAALAPPPAARFQLVGVVAPDGRSGDARRAVAQGAGVALIAIDGEPARAFRVGATVDGDTVLQSVQQRGATLGARGAQASLALELPPLPPPATGVPGSDATGATPASPLRPAMRVPPRPLPPPPGAMVPPPGAMVPPPTNLQAVEVEDEDPNPVQAPGGQARR